jgi:hypothetical protein
MDNSRQYPGETLQKLFLRANQAGGIARFTNRVDVSRRPGRRALFMNKLSFTLVAALLLVIPRLQGQNRIQFNGQDLFLSGANLAWQNFANDIGPNTGTPDTNHFAGVFDQIHTNGGNSLRLWLHTTGQYTPAWSGSTVTGPGSGTTNDLQKILDLAWQRKVGVILCLWSFDMLRTNNGATLNNRARDILTNATYRGTYITNSLIPMVQALKGNPAIIAWEIFNEPEGMSEEFGWDFNQHVPMSAIQAFINQCAGAIHRVDTNAKVSNGSWSFYATTDVGSGNFNYYTDARLIAAGGDPDGYLDFYMVHYYDWAGTERSPFQHPASYWGLTKPLVVAEFFPDPDTPNPCVNCGSQSYETLYQNGYAGALAWSWTDVSPSRILAQIGATSAAHPADVLIVDSNTPIVFITSPTNGATFADGATVSIDADASDPNGTVSKVEFFAGTTKLGEDLTYPYHYDWVSPTAGSYALFARVTDNDGVSNSSPVINITVGNPPGPTRYEAEAAAYNGNIAVGSDGTASGGQYLNVTSSGDITFSIVNVPSAGTYTMTIGFRLAYASPKTQNLIVNGGASTPVIFSGSTSGWLTTNVIVSLNAGNNQIQIQRSWGWMYFDYIEFPTLMANTAPVLAAISNRTINAGVTLNVTNTATDSGVPPQTLTFSLLNGPAYATLNAANGVFTWRPRVSQANTTNPVTVRVADNGTPVLSATNSFTVTVNPLAQPVISSIAATGGQVSLAVNGPAGPDYTLLSSTNLTGWQALFTTNSPALPLTLVDTNLNAAPRRFYRIQLGP